jgi:hypothetical protein
MDVDDISLPDRLQSQLVFMEGHPAVGVVGSSYYEIDDGGNRIGEIILPVEDVEIRRALPRFNPFNHSSVMIRTQALKELGPYDERLIHSQDYELWFRLLSRYEGHNLPEKLLLKRNPKGSTTVSRKRKQIYYSLMAWRMGRQYVKGSFTDYAYYIRMGFPYLLPSFMMPVLRNLFGRAKYTRRNQYYVIRLQP